MRCDTLKSVWRASFSVASIQVRGFLMLKPMLRAAALLAVALLIPSASASAANDDAKLVESLPPEVADVVTGGSWSEGKQRGFYRAIVVMSGSEQSFGARVYLQWLALSET